MDFLVIPSKWWYYEGVEKKVIKFRDYQRDLNEDKGFKYILMMLDTCSRRLTCTPVMTHGKDQPTAAYAVEAFKIGFERLQELRRKAWVAANDTKSRHGVRMTFAKRWYLRNETDKTVDYDPDHPDNKYTTLISDDDTIFQAGFDLYVRRLGLIHRIHPPTEKTSLYVIERVNKTFWQLLKKHFKLNNPVTDPKNGLNLLALHRGVPLYLYIENDYNTNTHSTVKRPPLEMTAFEERLQTERARMRAHGVISRTFKFKVGDEVKIATNERVKEVKKIGTKVSLEDPLFPAIFKVVGCKGYKYRVEEQGGSRKVFYRAPRNMRLVTDRDRFG
jgi:hypothetical protein